MSAMTSAVAIEHQLKRIGLFILVVFLPWTSVNAQDLVMFVGESLFDLDDKSEIHLIDGKGRAHRRIRTRYPVSNATLDPAGSTIAYLRADQPQLRSIGVDGRGDRLLARTQKRDRIGLSWSPDGRYIAYGHKTSFVVFSAVSVLDAQSNRVVASYELPRNHTLGATTHAVIDIDWSPNRRYLSVLEKTILFTGSTVRYEYHTTLIDTQNGRTVYFGDHRNYGFLNNRQYIAKLNSGDIGVVNIFNRRVSSLINLGPTQNISSIVRGPRGKNLLVVMKDAKESFSAGLTGLARLRGASRQAQLGYDLVRVNLSRKIADVVTPAFSAYREQITPERQMQWRATTPDSTFRTRSCWGWVVTKMGTSGDDRIIGTPFADVIYGGAGNDYIDGGGGNDVICGGPGHDRLYGKRGDDFILGDMSLNRIDESTPGFAGRDLIVAGPGADIIVGEGGNDVLRGGTGNDLVSGGSGNDRMNGQGGEDIGIGGDGRDQCLEFEQASECE